METILNSYLADTKRNIDIIVESFIRGTCHTWTDLENDRLVVSIIDIHNHMWSYEEPEIKSRLYSGLSASVIAYKVIKSYSEKIFSEYFK